METRVVLVRRSGDVDLCGSEVADRRGMDDGFGICCGVDRLCFACNCGSPASVARRERRDGPTSRANQEDEEKKNGRTDHESLDTAAPKLNAGGPGSSLCFLFIPEVEARERRRFHRELITSAEGAFFFVS